MARVLLLLPFPPRLDTHHGGGRALARMILDLAPRHQLALLCLRGSGEEEVDPQVRRVCDVVEEVLRPVPYLRRLRLLAGAARRPRWVMDWWVPAFQSRLIELEAEWKPDVLQFCFGVMGQYRGRGGVPSILSVHEWGVDAARSELAGVSGVRRVVQALDYLAWYRYERSVAGRMQAIVTLTERDRLRAVRLAPQVPAAVVPLSIPPPPQPLDPAGMEESVLFTGSFQHAPNVDAARRLVTSIFPLVRRDCPDASLVVLGDAPPDDLAAARHAGVQVVGGVPCIEPYLNRAAVVVAPLRLGGGMRVKVLEALGSGKAVVATRLAAAGLEGAPLVLSETDQEIAAAIAALLGDAEARSSLGRAAAVWSRTRVNQTERAYSALYRDLEARCRPSA